jgi:hypothetical protein
VSGPVKVEFNDTIDTPVFGYYEFPDQKEKILLSDIAKVYASNITNIKTLALFTGLRKLEIHTSNILNFGHIENLKNLTKLIIYNVPVINYLSNNSVTMLRLCNVHNLMNCELPNLEDFESSSCKFKTIPWFPKLKSLQLWDRFEIAKISQNYLNCAKEIRNADLNHIFKISFI